MPLTQKFTYQIEVTEDDHVQVRRRRIILDGDDIVSSSLERNVIAPGQNAAGEIGKARRMVAAAHVPTVVDKYQRRQDILAAKEARDVAVLAREADDTPETQAAEAAAEQAMLDAEAAAEAAEAAHEAFLASEDT